MGDDASRATKGISNAIMVSEETMAFKANVATMKHKATVATM
jgi:hypothetical protein